MCGHFVKTMEGDLADVVRATTGGVDGEVAAVQTTWQFSRNTINYSSETADQDLGDPFSYIRDPLMHTAPLSEFFYGSGSVEEAGINLVDDEMKRPPNSFSRMAHISPNTPCDSQAAAPPQRALKSPPILVSNNGTLISPSSSGLQISSPRNTGIKRRKSQAKKVVCIPAPAPANSRATGEIVPSDLWAWRKYGQKPIKGSPYPRGYYRCSSSKGCSARKQVERSRTDPNMLVITYTSEHNHPWPTQRNALAGSTRSQPSKNNNNNNNAAKTEKPTNKETSLVKEETQNQFDDDFPQTYKPTLPDSSLHDHEQGNFFTDLGEIGDDPLNLFQQGFSRPNHNDLDPFNFYDWPSNSSTTTAAAAEDSNPHS